VAIVNVKKLNSTVGNVVLKRMLGLTSCPHRLRTYLPLFSYNLWSLLLFYQDFWRKNSIKLFQFGYSSENH